MIGRFLAQMGIDEPEEFVLLVLAVGVEFFLAYLVLARNIDVDILWANPLVGFWLGRAGVRRVPRQESDG